MGTGAVIVAAGISSRMNECKQLMKIGGFTMAQRIILSFRSVGVEEIVVVTGFRADEVEASLSAYPVTFLRNERYRETQMFDSAKIGFSHLRDRCDRIFFCPADVPFFSVSTLRRLLEQTHPLVQPVTDGRIGHPILIHRDLIPAILDHTSEGGLQGALNSLGISPCFLPAADPGSLIDADTQADFQKLVALYQSLTEETGEKA